MNTSMEENTRLSDDYTEDSAEFSPPQSKRLRLEDDEDVDNDGCNNNRNSTLNSDSKNGRIWPRPGDTSFVEPEVMVDLGVSMLEDDTSCESTKKPQSQEFTTSPSSSSECSRQQLHDNDNTNLEEKQPFRTSSFEKITLDRLEQDPFHMEDPAVFNSIANESGYASRVETEAFTDKQSSFGRNDSSLNSSDADSLWLFKRKKRPSFTGEDKFNTLSDEMVLAIFKYLPKKCLVRSMVVCKRWCQIAKDEALWTRLDLGSKVLSAGTLGHILPRGVQILRLAQAEMADPVFEDSSEVYYDGYCSKLQYLDLSMAVISPNGLADLLSTCKLLKKLSLEKCTLNDACCEAIGKNPDISVLNLTMCDGITVQGIKHLMKLESLTALNMSWCSLDSESLTLLCKSLPQTVNRLNISGCRKTLTDDGVKDLVTSCPKLVELDLSDCTLLTINSVQSIVTLNQLEHLSLSRCYSIPPSTYLRLAYMPSLMYLDVFGLMAEAMLKSLQANSKGTEINKFLYSSVARPTVGVRRTSIWGIRVRD